MTARHNRREIGYPNERPPANAISPLPAPRHQANQRIIKRQGVRVMAQLPDPIEYYDTGNRRSIDDKLDEVILAINQIIEFLDGEEAEDE